MFAQDSVIAFQDTIIQMQAKQVDTLKAETFILVHSVDSMNFLTHEATRERDNTIANCNRILKRKAFWGTVKNVSLTVLSGAVIVETAIIYARK